MKRYIKSASFYGIKYNYGVFMPSSSGSIIRLGGSKTEEGANEIACDQAKSIAENPWTSAKEKVLKIGSIEVVDMTTDESVMFADTEDYLGDLISDINDGLYINASTKIEAKISDKDYSQSLKGVAYKVLNLNNYFI